jgi:hypothetical protein
MVSIDCGVSRISLPSITSRDKFTYYTNSPILGGGWRLEELRNYTNEIKMTKWQMLIHQLVAQEGLRAFI